MRGWLCALCPISTISLSRPLSLLLILQDASSARAAARLSDTYLYAYLATPPFPSLPRPQLPSRPAPLRPTCTARRSTGPALTALRLLQPPRHFYDHYEFNDPTHSIPLPAPSRISSRPLGPLASCQILLFFVPFALASAFAFAFAAHPHSHVRPAPFCSALSLCISRRRNTQLCFGGTLLRRSTQSSTPPDHIRRAVPEKSRLAIVCLSHWPLQVGSSCLFCPRFRSRS